MEQTLPVSGLDSRDVAVQWERFKELHPDLADPGKSFNDLLDVVGLQTVEQHLDDLEKLCSTLNQETTQFGFMWCMLLNREVTFSKVQLVWETESNRSVEEQISQLAFLQLQPTLSRELKTTHEERVRALNCHTSQEAEALFVTTGSAFYHDGEIAAQWQRFLNLHPELFNREASFKDFVEIVGVEAVKKHLDLVEDLAQKFKDSKYPFVRRWCQLLNRKLVLKSTLISLNIQSDESLKEHICQLAFSQQHPRLCRDFATTHEQRVAALNCSTLQEAEALFASKPQSQTLQGDIVAEGYDQEYLRSEEIVAPTLETLKEYSSDWSPALYVAPYTALIGPTMNGKTRLLKELSRHVCVVYICLRADASTGYPPRSEWAQSILIDPKAQSLQKQYELLLLAILHAAADFFDSQPQPICNSRPVMEKWIDHSFPKKDRTGDPPFWTDVENKMKNFARPFHTGRPPTLKDALKKIKQSTKFIRSPNLNLLLAIDEASQLLYNTGSPEDWTFFRIFRRMLATIPSASGIFSILADTTSRVPNFNPPAHLDPSHRPGKTGRKLFAPIYEIPTFDVNVSAALPTWQRLQSPLRLLQYGSPFFGVYVNAAQEKQSPEGIVQDLIYFALEKLLCVTDPASIAPSSLTDPQAIALLGSTIQPQLYGASHLNAELVSSHAAQCMYIDPTRQILISEYPSQITFSSAANQYLAADEARLIRCIEILTFIRRQGHIGPGDIGELVSRVILLRAMQVTMRKTKENEKKTAAAKDKAEDAMTKAREAKKTKESKKKESVLDTTTAAGAMTNSEEAKKKAKENAQKELTPDTPGNVNMPFGHSVRLADLLHTLTGKDPKKMNLGSITPENKRKLLDHGHLFWNHFVCLEHTPNSKDMLNQLCRGAAVQCKPNQFGFDQLFPIYLNPDPQAILNQEKITFCGIQVKNHKQPKGLQGDSHRWTPGFAKIRLDQNNPYLVLYFSLRDSKNEIITIPRNPLLASEDVQRGASLAFYSLSAFHFLSDGLKTALTELINAHPSILLLHENSPTHTKDYVNKVTPLVSTPDSFSRNTNKRKTRSSY